MLSGQFISVGSLFQIILHFVITLSFVLFFLYYSFDNNSFYFSKFLGENKIPIIVSLLFAALFCGINFAFILNYLNNAFIEVQDFLNNSIFVVICFSLNFSLNYIYVIILCYKIIYELTENSKIQILLFLIISILFGILFVNPIYLFILFLLKKYLFKGKNFSAIYTLAYGLFFIEFLYKKVPFYSVLIALLAIVLIQGSVMLVNKLKNKKRIALVEAKEIKNEEN